MKKPDAKLRLKLVLKKKIYDCRFLNPLILVIHFCSVLLAVYRCPGIAAGENLLVST